MDARRRASARHRSRPLPAAIALALVSALVLVGCGAPKPTPPNPPEGVDLTLALDGLGSVTVVADGDTRSCAVDCTLTFAAGTDVVLSATGAGGATFAGWSDGCDGAGSCTLTMDADAGVTARFRERVLTITLAGDSPVDFQVSPGDSETSATTCALRPGDSCAFAFDSVDPVDVSVQLINVPAGSTSDGFTGCVAGLSTDQYCRVTVERSASVSVTVRHPPTATADAYDWREDQTKTVPAAEGVLANDHDSAGDTLKAVLDRDVTKGTLTLADDGSFTYTPRADFGGSDNFAYHAVDAYGNASAGVNVQLTVTPVNDLPVPTPQTLFTEEDTALVVTLTATDQESDPITFAVVDPPAHGALTGSAPTLTYTPATNFNGNDAFTFTASDAGGTSAKATVTIQVGSVGDAPVGVSDGYVVLEDEVLVVPALLGVLANDQDADANLDRAELVTATAHGTLDLQDDGGFSYTPAANFDGSDTFTYQAVDADGQKSAATTVSIDVTAVNDAPVTSDSAETTAEDVPKVVALDATDVDGDTLTYTIVTPPARGALSGTGATRTYAPDPNYNGPDTFSFKVNDGTLESNVATVVLTVTPVNDPPTADSQDVDAVEDTPIDITLSGSDVDEDTLTFEVASGPSHGTLLPATGATYTYTPATNYSGDDGFTFVANDGTTVSAAATVSITVADGNDAPSATAQTITTPEDSTPTITLTGSDPEGDALTFEVTEPSHGTLSDGTGAARSYTPDSNYNGPDSFTFTVNDGALDSAPATVSITVTAVNDAPIANGQTVAAAQDTAIDITLTGSDVDGDTLSFTVVDQPDNGALTGAGAALTYTPTPSYFGDDSFTFVANDGTADSEAATVTINVGAAASTPSLTPTASSCDGVATSATCVVQVSLRDASGSYRGAEFDFGSDSFALDGSAKGQGIASGCLVGNGPSHVILACGTDQAFGAGELVRLTLRRSSPTPTTLVVSNALLATTALARLPVGGGALSID